MEKKNKIIIVLSVVAIFALGGIAIWVTYTGEEVETKSSVDIYSNDGNTVFTLVGDGECEKDLLIYYNNRPEGDADNEYIFYIADDDAPSSSFMVYTSELTVLAGIDNPHSNAEVIRLPYIDYVEKMPLSVSINNESEEYFEKSNFVLSWRNMKGGPDNLQVFLIRYYNIDKISSLNWSVPEGFNLTFDNDWIERNYVDATTNQHGWYMLKGYINNDIEPWRSTDVDLWFNPDQNETHMVPYEV